MNVKVDVTRISPWTVESYQNDREAFVEYFDSINIKIFEPRCPFCGKELKNSQCSCEHFEQAYKKLCSKYYSNIETCHSKAYDIQISNLICIEPNKIKIEEVSPYNIDISFFDNGSIASGYLNVGIWFVSHGTYNDNILTFYVRKKGKNQIYKCEIKHQMELPRFSEVTFYQFRRKFFPRGHNCKVVGNYTIKHENEVIDKISYEEFLTRLKETK